MLVYVGTHHGDVRGDGVIQGAFLNVLGDEVALVLYHVQRQSLVRVTEVIVWQRTSTF